MNKQETVQEAAERLAKDHCSKRVNTNTTEFQVQQLILKGAKWQANRMYSEIDMLEYVRYMLLPDSNLSPKEWLEQFKKKV